MTQYLRDRVSYVKWLLPPLFVAGYAVTASHFPNNAFEYAVYSMLALCSGVVLVSQLKLFERAHFAAWFALILLVMGYFIRFYWITLDPWPVERMLPWNPFRAMIVNRDALLQAFKLSVVAFVCFCGMTAGLLYFQNTSSPVAPASSRTGEWFETGAIARWLLIGLVPLMIALAFVSYHYKIGEMGASASDALPFRLNGAVFYGRTVSVPLGLLLCIYLAEHSGRFVVSRAGILVLLIHGVGDMLLRNSRSSLLLVLLLLVFLVLSGGLKLRPAEKVLLGLAAAAAFLAVPIMTDYRQIRLIHDLPHVDALLGAIKLSGENLFLQLVKGLKFVLFRMPGIESLWCEITLGAKPLGIHSIDIISSKNGIAGYLTYVIHPMKESNNTLLAPGFVGWFFLVAGTPAIVVGALLTGAISVLGWKYLDLRYLRAGPVAQAFLLWMLFIALTEGTLDSMLLMVLAGMATVAAMEAGLRLLPEKLTVAGRGAAGGPRRPPESP